MADAEVFRLPTCLACAGPTRAQALLCQDCSDAFRLARGIHPSAPVTPVDDEDLPIRRRVEDDMTVWDEWSLLGDVGHGAGRLTPD
jgi:hypothetical protein